MELSTWGQKMSDFCILVKSYEAKPRKILYEPITRSISFSREIFYALREVFRRSHEYKFEWW